MKLLFIVLIIVIILFIPIPFKLNIYFSEEDYYVKLYRLTLFSKQKTLTKKVNGKVLKKTKIRKDHILKNKKFNSLILKLYKLNFKPTLRIKYTLEYSLNDAAKTAIFYGVLCQLSELIYSIIDLRFKIKKYTFDINPIFKDKLLLKFEISSIIFLSFVHIIYILIIALRSIINFREVNP